MFNRMTGVALLGAFLMGSPALAGELKPFQKAGLDKILATMDPVSRSMTKPQLEMMMQNMTKDQVDKLVTDMTEGAGSYDEAEDTADDNGSDGEATPVTPADLAYNKGQYEPMIRKLWDEKRACEAFAAKTFAAQNPNKTYAVWGEAWRYDLHPLEVRFSHTADDFDMFAITFRGTAPTDGRYQFDFSKVDTRCNRPAIEAAIKKTFADYTALGTKFVDEIKAYRNQDASRPKADSVSEDGDGDAGVDIESQANQRVLALGKALEEAFVKASPSGDQALVSALMMAKPARH